MTNLIGMRIKALREERKLSQDDLARVFGFKDRQTVSAIETGERRVSAEELLTAVEKLGAPLDYFTNPFLLVGEGRFSWRQSGVGVPNLEGFERSAGRWIAAYRTLAPQVGLPIPLLRRTLGLTPRDSFEDAAVAGERFAAEFDLGDVPASRLAEIMERQLGVLVLMVDAVKGVSGAACRLPALDTVLINRREAPGRRHFDLAHELFHILTWDTMPPEHVEDATEQSTNRVEQLANSFASALLMPASVLEHFGPWGNDLIPELNATANTLAVTATALKWRLVALGRLDRTAAKQIPDAALRNNGRRAAPSSMESAASAVLAFRRVDERRTLKAALRAQFGEVPPPLFSKTFVEVINRSIDQGRVTARRAADLLDTTLEDFVDLCALHGIEAPIDL
jgi:Zn-dependent peptidase ImmA (M78 family)/DNA-binding XRE family transcriptional regulator